MKKESYYLIRHFALCLLCFLLIQKPLFLIYNWGYQDINVTIKDIVDIYINGFSIDTSTAAYLTIFPLIIIWIHLLKPSLSYIPWLKWYNLFVSILISLSTVADAALYEFWGFKLDRMVFFYINDPKNAFASVSLGYLCVRILIVLGLVFIVWKILCIPLRFIQKDETMAPTKMKVWVVCVVMLLFAGLDFVFVRGLRVWPKTPARVYYSSITYFNHAALNPLYNVIYSIQKSENFAKQFRYMTEDERALVMEDLFPLVSDSTDVFIRNQRPNVLFIVLEGMGGYFVKSLDNMHPVAENIDSVMNNYSFWFPNAYAGSFRTDRGIVCALSGYLGQPTTSIMRYTRKIHSLPGIAKTLRKVGYETQMLYSGDITFFNMADYFLAIGHDKLISQNNFPESDHITQWGVPDHIAFQWLYDDIQEKEKSGKKWYTSYLTISSHTPFDVPFHKYEDKEDNAFAYTDSCFGDFIFKLKSTPAWDNLLIVCVADHGYNAIPSEDPLFPHIPLFFTGGVLNRTGREERIISQTDIAATLLGQMGLPHDDFIFSRDVMSCSYTNHFAMMSFNNGFQYRDTTGITVFDLVTDKAIFGQDQLREHKAKAILQTLYNDLNER